MTGFLVAMLEMNLAAAAAITLVLLTRRKMHKVLGPDATYLMWAIVPVAMLATLIPSRTVEVFTTPVPFSGEDTGPAPLLLGATSTIDWSAIGAGLLVLVWAAGAFAMLMFLAKRQRLFMEDVGLRKAGPAVVGFFYPHVVTPADFSHRFSDQERKLILAHEQVHLERHDIRINALATLVRCLCWFNPLVHIGARYLRTDQELSCDAAVIERRPRARRVYAETLLKTQLAERPLPVGCYWPPENPWATSHPLTERIAMLTTSPLSHPRRLAAATAVLALVGGGGFAAWAAQPVHLVVVAADHDRLGPDIMVPFEPLAPDDRMADPETVTLILPAGRGAADNPTPAPQTKIYSPSDPGVTRPRMSMDNAFPDYPAESLALREEGDVLVVTCVSASGNAQVQRIERSSGSPRLDQATVAGLPNMKFEPGRHEGAPVDVCGYMLTMRWTLPTAAPPTPTPTP